MAHCGNDRGFGFMDGSSHFFLIERPQVFQRASTTSHNDDFNIWLSVQRSNSRTDFPRGFLALDPARVEEDGSGETIVNPSDHVPHSGSGSRRHQPNRFG